MKILLIEDNTQIAKAYEAVLSAAGHELDTVSNPLVGISKALRANYSLILADYMLPEIRGDELLKRLKGEGVEAPIVIMTNLGSGFDEDSLLELGAEEVLLKSAVGPEELRDVVLKYAKK